MAENSKKTAPGRPFKPGESGNPGGRPKLPEDVKQAKLMNRIELTRLVNRLVRMKRHELAELIKNPDASSMEIMIGTIIVKAAQQGDPTRLSFLLDRLVGKVKNETDLTVLPKPTVIVRRNGDQVILGAKLADELEDEQDE
jgi:hypothetical protein